MDKRCAAACCLLPGGHAPPLVSAPRRRLSVAPAIVAGLAPALMPWHVGGGRAHTRHSTICLMRHAFLNVARAGLGQVWGASSGEALLRVDRGGLQNRPEAPRGRPESRRNRPIFGRPLGPICPTPLLRPPPTELAPDVLKRCRTSRGIPLGAGGGISFDVRHPGVRGVARMPRSCGMPALGVGRGGTSTTRQQRAGVCMRLCVYMSVCQQPVQLAPGPRRGRRPHTVGGGLRHRSG